jgi:hypothetical protein
MLPKWPFPFVNIFQRVIFQLNLLNPQFLHAENQVVCPSYYQPFMYDNFPDIADHFGSWYLITSGSPVTGLVLKP